MFGPEHPDTLTVRADLAGWTGKAGDPAAARDQFAALLPVRERVSGPEYPDTLDARHELAFWTGEAGDADGARDQYAALVPVCERVSGAEHPHTLTARDNLARWTGQARDRPPPGTSTPRCCRCASGCSARSTRTPCAPAATSPTGPGMPGDPAAARDQYAALLPVYERVFGPEHPDTLRTRSNLADWAEKAERGPSRA